MCDKIPYSSRHKAKMANAKNGNTLRFYLCDDCHAWHGTKQRRPGRKR